MIGGTSMGMTTFINSVLLITIIVTFLLRKKYHLPTGFRLYRHRTPFHKRLEFVLLVLYILAAIVTMIFFTYSGIYLLLFAFFATLMIIRAFIEYKHEPDEKEYIIRFIWFISWGILFIGWLFMMV